MMKAQIRILIIFFYAVIFNQLLYTKGFAAIEYEHFTFKNGLNLYVISNHKVPAVNNMIWYNVGSSDEITGKTGIAHFLEHLMFKGTEKVENGDFSKLVGQHGGHENAFTSKDYTGYYQVVPTSLIEDVIKMEADRMTNLVIPEEEFEAEKNVVLEERNSRVENSPSAILQEKLMTQLFANYPYEAPVIGYRKDIEGLKLQEVMAFYKKYYRPSNATVVISGDITANNAFKLVSKHFANIANPEDKIEHPIFDTIITPASKLVEHSDANVGQRIYMEYYIAPSSNYNKDESNIYALKIACELLGGSSTAYLYKELVAKDKLASAAGCSYGMHQRGASYLTIYATPNKGVTLEAIKTATLQKKQDFISNKITEDKLNKTVNRYIKSSIFSQEGVQNLGLRVGRLVGHNVNVAEINNWQDKFLKLKADEVTGSLKKLMDKNNKITAYLKDE